MDENSKDSFDSFENVSPRKRPPQRTVLAELSDSSFDEPSNKRRRNENAEIVKQKRRSPALHVDSDTTKSQLQLGTSTSVTLKVQSVSTDGSQISLQCINDKNGQSFVYLQHQWAETPVNVGNTIRLFDAKRWDENDWIVDADQGLVVVEPDTLISATSVAQALFCARKTVLNERFRGGNASNKAMLMGSIIHELFQKALFVPPMIVSAEWLLSQWRASIEENPSYLIALVALDFTPSAFEAELQPYVKIICQWINEKIGTHKPLPSGSRVKSVSDIEENIWIPSLGLKGKLDSTLIVNNKGDNSYLEPLELKTGKSGLSIEHNLQVLLYCVMLAIRDDQPVNSGSLLYLKDGVSRCVTPKLVDLKGAFQVRNRLATFTSKISTNLPEPISENRACLKCDHALTCTLSKFNAQTVSPTFKELVATIGSHLPKSHVQYFEKWTGMLTLEWKTALSRVPNLSSVWKMPSHEREKRGSCISNLQINACKKGANEKFNIKLTR
ncbi:unnamed protein product, partial [Mesorhabditis belari]|uniref:DNA replication ATP-dependent helicase/nuclease DNA2 n=1 Tax=Mesorhabditis belari TaxID=2138241 RepID=A0AAF3J642_9BILA